MNQDFYHKLVSGHKKGCFAALLNILLTAISKVYSVVIELRNLLYNRQVFKIYHHEAVVISIGNITLGGTGKTPLVIWLCNQLIQISKLKAQNYNFAILTRGYKTENRILSDEVAILNESCPQAEVIVNPDRVAGAAEAVAKFNANILIMDDGFQHRRLARNLDIITIDSMQPFGYGKIFPAGLLREPVTSLKRADAVVITRCDQIATSELSKIENKLQAINPDMIIARSVHSVVGAKTADSKSIKINNLNGKKIFAFCGIGNPNTFLNTIKALGTELAGSKIYNDHYRYTDACLADIYEQARLAEADIILTTQKDWTKIRRLTFVTKGIPLAYLTIEIKFLAGEDKLRSLIDNTLAGKISKSN